MTRTAALILMLLLTACAGQDTATQDTATQDTATQGTATQGTPSPDAASPATDGEAEGADATTLSLQGADGGDMGTVELSQTGDGLHVRADVTGLPGGDFHGFHFHQTPSCEADDPDGAFMSAEGHYNPDDATHAVHAGDMPPLLARGDGTATAEFTTDRLSLDDLLAGAALIVHADRDNQGNIPDRYTADGADAPGPDEDTLSTGDAGSRLACAVIE